MNVALDDPEIYATLRLALELNDNSILYVRQGLDFEMQLFKEKPELLLKVYRTEDHFLSYISTVKQAYATWQDTGKLPNLDD